MSINVLIADDHAVVLDGLRALLSLEPDVEVIGTCANGLEVLEVVKTLKPDVLLMDVAMPSLSGIETRVRLVEAGVLIPTVLLSASVDDTMLMRCLELGVEGVVLKESASADLVAAVRTVAEGGRAIADGLSRRAIELLGRPQEAASPSLTPREHEVATAVATGASNKRIAALLGIAEGTVKLHVHRVFKKLGVANRVELSLRLGGADGPAGADEFERRDFTVPPVESGG